MNYHVDRDVRLSVEEEYKNLYRWSLQEFTKEGTPIGRNQVPWQWSLVFSASELRHHRSLTLDRRKRLNDDATPSGTFEEAETIVAVLRAGIWQEGQWQRDVAYSMFGTGRKLQSISLDIIRLDSEAATEGCSMLGGLSYTSELDFRDITTEDWLGVVLSVVPSKFDALRNAVTDDSIHSLQLSLTGVSGFYAEWSPSISADDIKILLPASEHPVARPDGCEIEPLRLGDVQKVYINVVRRKQLELDQALKSVNPLSPSEKEGPVDEESQVASERRDLKARSPSHVDATEAAIAKLTLPLWIIVGLLGLIWLT